MIEIIKLFTIRMLCGCTISSIALLLIGEGSHREPVRICCATLMIVLLFMPYEGQGIDLSELKIISSDIESSIYTNVEESEKYETEVYILSLEEFIQDKLGIEGIDCNVKINYELNDKTIKITKVYLKGETDLLEIDKIFNVINEYIKIDRSDLVIE